MNAAVAHPPYIDPDATRLLVRARTPRAALFLDRDGVINIDHGYVHTPEATQWCPGIFDRVRTAWADGLVPIVVTNQAGIGRGRYTEAAFLDYTRWVHEVFRSEGAPLLATYYCPHHPSAGVGDYLRDCAHRKPGAGMIEQAMREWDIDPWQSRLVGDKPSDGAAAIAAGLRCELVEILGPCDAGEMR